jgi:hypothetical protein
MSDEIHSVLREISGTISRTEAKVDMLLDTQKDHAVKIDNLEGLRDKMFGYLMALSAVFAAVWHFLPKAFASILSGH